MKPQAKVVAMLIFTGFMALLVVSASENNSTPQSMPTDWREYTPLVGVIGTAIGIYSLLERRKDKSRNARINEWLEGNVNLSDLRNKLEKLEGSKQEIQNYMENALTISVQNVALKERAKMQADLVAKSYLDYKQTVDKLKEILPEAEIPASIKPDILNLVPEYEKQREKDALKDRVTVLSIALLIVNSVLANLFGFLFYPIQWVGNAVLGSLLVFSLIQLAKPQIIEFDTFLQRHLRKGVRTSHFIAYIFSFLCGMFLLFFGILLFMLQSNYTTHEERLVIGGFIIFGALLFTIGGIKTYFSLRNRRISPK